MMIPVILLASREADAMILGDVGWRPGKAEVKAAFARIKVVLEQPLWN